MRCPGGRQLEPRLRSGERAAQLLFERRLGRLLPVCALEHAAELRDGPSRLLGLLGATLRLARCARTRCLEPELRAHSHELGARRSVPATNTLVAHLSRAR
jgi:hypothetical protein